MRCLTGVCTDRCQLLVLLAAVALTAAGCGDDPSSPSAAVVSEVRLANVPDSLLIGETATLTATPLDDDGDVVANAVVTWTSADETIVTVDDTGVVTALASGVTMVRAASGSAAAEGEITVRVPTVVISADTALEGTVQARTLTVPAGVNITANGPLTFDVAERATVLGSITADCHGVSIYAGGPVSVSGTVSTACSDSMSASVGKVTIVGVDSVSVGGEIVTSGGLYISNDISLTDADFPPFVPPSIEGDDEADAAARGYAGATYRVPTPLAAARAMRHPMKLVAADGSGECHLTGRHYGSFPPFTPDGESGRSAPDQVVRCEGRIVMKDYFLEADDGADGGAARVSSSTFAEATAADGGTGGNVRIESTGDILVMSGVFLTSGDGGSGGGAFATGLDGEGGPTAAGAEATGGSGGPGGTIRIHAGGTVTGNPTLRYGSGGDGGFAVAIGANGRDANETESAQAGGIATARGGRAGSAEGPSFAARGGSAEATGGRGGDGGPAFVDGAAGGAAHATGGRGGRSRTEGYSGGAGGGIWLAGGWGGTGFGSCEPATAQGGAGGRGGSIGGRVGAPGSGAPWHGTPPDLALVKVANGGDGGDGLLPGPGGEAGLDATDAEGADKSVEEPSLRPGAPGGSCEPETKVGILLGSPSMSQHHQIGISPCPQEVGATSLTNTGNVAITFTVPHTAGLTITPSSGTLEPGEVTVLTVQFNCDVPESFTAEIGITATSAGGETASTQLTVEMDVEEYGYDRPSA